MTFAVDGHGLLASMVRTVISGTRTSTVTSVTAASFSDSLFAIPEGWSRDRK
jgi:hypothetical protein